MGVFWGGGRVVVFFHYTNLLIMILFIDIFNLLKFFGKTV